MIAQVLNREFLLQAATLVRDELEHELVERRSPRRRRGGIQASAVNDLSDGELAELVDGLGDSTREREELMPSVQPGEADGEPLVRPKDDFAFLPRDVLLSLVQTTIDEYAEENDDVA